MTTTLAPSLTGSILRPYILFYIDSLKIGHWFLSAPAAPPVEVLDPPLVHIDPYQLIRLAPPRVVVLDSG